jgi:hypothetical protein
MRLSRRIWLIPLAACVVLTGCGVQSYEKRMQTTLSNMRYRMRLDANLQPGVEGKLKEEAVYLRPPTYAAKAPDFLLNPPPAGMFDIAESFDGTPQTGAGEGSPRVRLHVLGRVKKKRATPAKGAPAPAAAPAAQGDFQTDVRNLLATAFGPAASTTAIKKGIRKRSNTYDLLTFNAANGSVVSAYFLKQNEFEVALVWDVPPDVRAQSSSGVDLCLESFAVGRRAATLFETGGAEDEGEAPTGEGGAATL